MAEDLTIDVGVLMAASDLSHDGYEAHSLALAVHIESTAGWGIALDRKGRIDHQYRQKLRHYTFAYQWLIRLATTNKIVIVNSRIDRGTRVALDENHFDPEDRKYVETAAKTRCRVLVSHDDDYSAAVCTVLRRVNVTVSSAEHAIAP